MLLPQPVVSGVGIVIPKAEKERLAEEEGKKKSADAGGPAKGEK